MGFNQFWFESNEVFRAIKTEEDLGALATQYAQGLKIDYDEAIQRINCARRDKNTQKSMPEFGMYPEHNGVENLKFFMETHGMEWPESVHVCHCGAPSIGMHECPYQEELHGGGKECNCCPSCTEDCARDI